MSKSKVILPILSCLLLLQACKKGNSPSSEMQTITATVKSGQTYKSDLGNYGDEEGVTITRQAAHFQVSSIDRDLSSGKISLKYAPAPNYTGTDEVVVQSSKGSDGASPNNKVISITFKFTITP